MKGRARGVASVGGARRARASLRLTATIGLVLGASACAGILGLDDRTVADGGGADASQPSPDGSLPSSDANAAPEGRAPPVDASVAVDSTADSAPAPPEDAGPSTADSAPPIDDGSACAGDACGPVAIVVPNGTHQPLAIAQDDTNLYFADFGQLAIYTMSKDGGTPRTLYMYPSSNLPATIAVDDTNVYWGDNDGIWRCPKTGCPTTRTRTLVVPVDPNKNDILSIAVDPTNVYWTDDFVFTVESAPLSGADAGTVLWSGGNLSPERVTADGRRVYFTADDGLLHVVGVDGGSPSTVGTYNDAGSVGITYVNQTVTWAISASGTGTIEQTSTANLGAQTIVSGQNLPTFVASDGLNVYWLTFGLNGNGTLRGCTILNCQPSTLYSPIQTPRAILVDNNWIFWLDVGTGSIWRLAK